MLPALLLAAPGAHAHPAAPNADAWASVREGLEAWSELSFGGDYAVHVGDETGSLFRWESPGFSSATTRMAGASLSKWPAAIMITGLVNEGVLDFDDLANKHLSWWSTNADDPRSRVTLRHLLSFRSGYMNDGIVHLQQRLTIDGSISLKTFILWWLDGTLPPPPPVAKPSVLPL